MVERDKYTETLASKKRVVAAVIFNSERNAVLLGQRADCGLWEFIGGKVKEQEGFKKAMIREIKEELDLEVIPGELLDTIDHDLEGDIGVVSVNFIECEPVGDIFLGRNFPFHDQLTWVKLEDLSGLKLIGSDAVFGQKLAENFYFQES
jgi:8-oxo-dGTP diphosphatase